MKRGKSTPFGGGVKLSPSMTMKVGERAQDGPGRLRQAPRPVALDEALAARAITAPAAEDPASPTILGEGSMNATLDALGPPLR